MTPVLFKQSGGLGGVQAGFNFQVSPSWLAGIEADIQGSDIKGSGTSTPFLLVGAPSNTQASQSVRWFGTVRGRLGWLASQNLLFYATGGLAYGGVHSDAALNAPFFTNLVSSTSFLCDPGPNCFVGRSSNTSVGWTVGGGLEYALTSHLSLKAEYMYVSLQGDSVTATAILPQPGQTVPLSTFNANFSDTNFALVRIGVNARF